MRIVNLFNCHTVCIYGAPGIKRFNHFLVLLSNVAFLLSRNGCTTFYLRPECDKAAIECTIVDHACVDCPQFSKLIPRLLDRKFKNIEATSFEMGVGFLDDCLLCLSILPVARQMIERRIDFKENFRRQGIL